MDNWALDSDCLSYLAAEEVAQLFEKKELSPPQDPLKKDVPYSRLTDLLESSVSMGENPFLEYAKFDGKVRQKKVGAISVENLFVLLPVAASKNIPLCSSLYHNSITIAIGDRGKG